MTWSRLITKTILISENFVWLPECYRFKTFYSNREKLSKNTEQNDVWPEIILDRCRSRTFWFLDSLRQNSTYVNKIRTGHSWNRLVCFFIISRNSITQPPSVYIYIYIYWRTQTNDAFGPIHVSRESTRIWEIVPVPLSIRK